MDNIKKVKPKTQKNYVKNNEGAENAKTTDQEKINEENTSVETEKYTEQNTESNENSHQEFTPLKSTDLLHDKLIGDLDNLSLEKGVGILGISAYGAAKGAVEATPQGARLAMNLFATESIIETKVTSKAASQALNTSFDVVNAALLPEQWYNYSGEVFSEIESSLSKVGRMTGDNFNVARSAGARVNFIINAAFAGCDGYRVGEYYKSQGQEVIEHSGEIAGRVLGETIGGAGGFAAGMAIGTVGSAAITGAVCGSVVPGVGTAVGFAAGAVIGAVGAVVVGDIAATAGSYIDGNNGEIVNL